VKQGKGAWSFLIGLVSVRTGHLLHHGTTIKASLFTATKFAHHLGHIFKITA
jgi:hypothetical protein